jgi:hypothetical protein
MQEVWMSYVKPTAVDSPKNRWRLRKVLYDGGKGEWSAAEGQWDNGSEWDYVLAMRWNGTDEAPIGNPQSRGLATWFIVPDELRPAIRARIADLQREKEPS